MECAYHPRNEAVAQCVNCRKVLCADCRVLLDRKNYCRQCAAGVALQQPSKVSNIFVGEKLIGEEIPRISNVEQSLYKLHSIGKLKLGLPVHLQDWVNALGLYVQLRHTGRWWRLAAGARFWNYFDAYCRESDYNDAVSVEANAWEVRRFERETWDRRFAHLVEPTLDIALFVSGGDDTKSPESPFDERAASTLTRIVKHFEATGEWLGLPSGRKCATCGRDLSVGQWQRESCPHCGGKLQID
jgi:hypothetical protein